MSAKTTRPKPPTRHTVRNKKLKWTLFSILSDLLLVNAGVILAFLIRFGGHLPRANFDAYLSLAAYMTGAFFVSFYVHDLYDLERQTDVADVIVRLIQANLVAILVSGTLSFFIRAFAFPRTVFIISFFTIGALVVGFRYLSIRLFPLDLPEQWVAVIGEGALAQKIAAEVEKRAALGLRFAGVITMNDDEEPSSAHVSDREMGTAEHPANDVETVSSENTGNLPVLGSIRQLGRILASRAIDRLILTSYEGHKDVVNAVLTKERPGMRIQVVPGIYEICIGRVSIETLGDIPVIDLSYEPETAWAKFGKPVFDVIASAVLLMILSPLLLIIALLVKLTSDGPAIYRQERVGKDEHVFICYKFRTMVKDAEKMSGPRLAGEKDPRVTPIGRFLRRYRLDELPQLYNILRGDMSFVGPRPERPEFVKKFNERIPGYRERHRVRPGATGLAQVYGAYETDAETKLKYDLIYVYNLSFLLDMRILFKTISVVLTGKGAR